MPVRNTIPSIFQRAFKKAQLPLNAAKVLHIPISVILYQQCVVTMVTAVSWNEAELVLTLAASPMLFGMCNPYTLRCRGDKWFLLEDPASTRDENIEVIFHRAEQKDAV